MADYDYSVGNYVLYKANGVCLIADITEKDTPAGKTKYYILKPVYCETATVYVPTNSPDLKKNMRRVLTKQEIDSLIDETEKLDDNWSEDRKLRAEIYSDILSKGNRKDILLIVKSLSLHKSEIEKAKRRFGANDSKVLAAAEKLITDEFAFSLGIKQDEVIPYIIKRTGR